MRLTRTELMIIALIFPFLEPAYFETIPLLNNFFTLAKYGMLFILIIMYTFYMIRNKKWPSKFSVAVLFLNAFPIIRMMQVGTFKGEPVKQLIIVVAYILIFELYKNKFEQLIKSLLLIFEILIYVNLATIILFPDGLYHAGLYLDNWFLGYSNSEIKYLVTGILIAFVYGYITKTWKRSIVLTIVSVVTIIRMQVVTGVVGIAIMIMLFVLQNKRGVKIFNLRNIMIIAACCFVYFVIQKNVVNYTDMIARYTGKTFTFTTRFDIWEKSVEMWLDNPWLGYGWATHTQRGVEYMNIYATHAHNTYLEYLYLGGIVGLILFVSVIYMIYNSMKKYQSLPIAHIIYACIGGYLIMMLVEAYTQPIVQLMYLVCYYTGMTLKLYVSTKNEITDGKYISAKKLC